MSGSITLLSDGVELELASGETVRPVLETEDGEQLLANRIWEDDGVLVYGRDADDRHVTLSFERQD